MALIDNLQAWWTMDETSGTRADSHTNSLDLTDNNTVGYAAGKISNAADFVGASSEYLSRTDEAAIGAAGATDFAFACWVSVDNLWVVDYIISKWQGGGSNNDEFYLGWSNRRFVCGVRGFDNSSQTITSTGMYNAATWYLVQFWRDGTNIYLDVNNSGSPDSAAWSTAQKDASVDFYVGRLGGTYYDGLVDELAFWKGGYPSAAEWTQLYNGGAGLTYTDIAPSGCLPMAMNLFRRRRT